MNRIAELRKELGLTQSELAARLGIKQNTLSQYETGLRPPSSRIVLLLSDICDASPGYILGEDTPRKPVKSSTPRSLGDVTIVKQVSAINEVNSYLRSGWHLLHIGEDREIYPEGTGYSTVVYSLGWFGDQNHPYVGYAQDYIDHMNDEPLVFL